LRLRRCGSSTNGRAPHSQAFGKAAITGWIRFRGQTAVEMVPDVGHRFIRIRYLLSFGIITFVEFDMKTSRPPTDGVFDKEPSVYQVAEGNFIELIGR
jgi:hypothetical protein